MAEDKMNKTYDEKAEKESRNLSAEENNGEDKNSGSKDVKDQDVSVKENEDQQEETQDEESGNKEAEKIIELETKFNELSDKHLRLQAEFNNYRKRTIKEKSELIKSGGEDVLKGILPVVDDFERAIDSMKEIDDDDAGKQGTLLIYSKFKDFLKQNNVKEIEALHQDFDVDHHEALTKIPAPEKKLKGKVVDVVQKGYTLNDKVIRFAKVVVGE